MDLSGFTLRSQWEVNELKKGGGGGGSLPGRIQSQAAVVLGKGWG